MKIAIPYESGSVFQHFGHTEQFQLYRIENGRALAEQLVDTEGAGHGALAGFLKERGVEALVCGGIGPGAREALKAVGIAVYGGVSGKADEAAQALARGELHFDPNARCDHHDHAEGHACGNHGCGQHE